MSFKTTLIEALNCADRIVSESTADPVGWDVDDFMMSGNIITLSLDDGDEEIQLHNAEVEIDGEGFVQVVDVEGNTVGLTFYIEDSRPMNQWDIQVPHGPTDKLGEEAWRTICEKQGWNDYSQSIHLEGFIRREGLFARFAEYAARCAQDENNEAAHAPASPSQNERYQQAERELAEIRRKKENGNG